LVERLFSIDYCKRFLTGLQPAAWSGIHNNSSDLTLEQRIFGQTSNNVQGNKQTSVEKRNVGLCQGRKTALRPLVTLDTAHCYNRNTL